MKSGQRAERARLASLGSLLPAAGSSLWCLGETRWLWIPPPGQSRRAEWGWHSAGASTAGARGMQGPGAASGTGEELGTQEAARQEGAPPECSCSGHSASRLPVTSQKRASTQEISAWYRGRGGGGTLGNDQESSRTTWSQIVGLTPKAHSLVCPGQQDQK